MNKLEKILSEKIENSLLEIDFLQSKKGKEKKLANYKMQAVLHKIGAIYLPIWNVITELKPELHMESAEKLLEYFLPSHTSVETYINNGHIFTEQEENRIYETIKETILENINFDIFLSKLGYAWPDSKYAWPQNADITGEGRGSFNRLIDIFAYVTESSIEKLKEVLTFNQEYREKFFDGNMAERLIQFRGAQRRLYGKIPHGMDELIKLPDFPHGSWQKWIKRKEKSLEADQSSTELGKSEIGHKAQKNITNILRVYDGYVQKYFKEKGRDFIENKKFFVALKNGIKNVLSLKEGVNSLINFIIKEEVSKEKRMELRKQCLEYRDAILEKNGMSKEEFKKLSIALRKYDDSIPESTNNILNRLNEKNYKELAAKYLSRIFENAEEMNLDLGKKYNIAPIAESIKEINNEVAGEKEKPAVEEKPIAPKEEPIASVEEKPIVAKKTRKKKNKIIPKDEPIIPDEPEKVSNEEPMVPSEPEKISNEEPIINGEPEQDASQGKSLSDEFKKKFEEELNQREDLAPDYKTVIKNIVEKMEMISSLEGENFVNEVELAFEVTGSAIEALSDYYKNNPNAKRTKEAEIISKLYDKKENSNEMEKEEPKIEPEATKEDEKEAPLSQTRSTSKILKHIHTVLEILKFKKYLTKEEVSRILSFEQKYIIGSENALFDSEQQIENVFGKITESRLTNLIKYFEICYDVANSYNLGTEKIFFNKMLKVMNNIIKNNPNFENEKQELDKHNLDKFRKSAKNMEFKKAIQNKKEEKDDSIELSNGEDNEHGAEQKYINNDDEVIDIVDDNETNFAKEPEKFTNDGETIPLAGDEEETIDSPEETTNQIDFVDDVEQEKKEERFTWNKVPYAKEFRESFEENLYDEYKNRRKDAGLNEIFENAYEESVKEVFGYDLPELESGEEIA